jgi:hypothetical protein
MSSYTDQYEFEVERIYYIVLRNANKLLPQELMNVISMIFFGLLQRIWGKQLFYDQTMDG